MTPQMQEGPEDPREHLEPAETPLPQAQVPSRRIQGEEVARVAGTGQEIARRAVEN